jgi:hypothetical protein
MFLRSFSSVVLLALVPFAVARAAESANTPQDVGAQHSENMAAGLAIFKSQIRGIFVE